MTRLAGELAEAREQLESMREARASLERDYSELQQRLVQRQRELENIRPQTDGITANMQVSLSLVSL